ncbi:MAG: hypothetical protein AAF429_12505 [Pseudomonadota bacterium]
MSSSTANFASEYAPPVEKTKSADFSNTVSNLFTRSSKFAEPLSAHEFVSVSQSPWSATLEKKLEELVSLEPGWDGYKGLALNFRVAGYALEVLNRMYVPNVPPPCLVPIANGTLQAEWHINGMDLELQFRKTLPQIEVFFYNEANAEVDEFSIAGDIKRPIELVKIITNNQNGDVLGNAL